MICVKYKGELRALTGTGEETFDCKDLKELTRLIKKAHGRKTAQAVRRCCMVVNGQRADRHLELKDQDEVVFIPVCGGG